MDFVRAFFLAALLAAMPCHGESVTVKIEADSPGSAIADDFIGLSFETSNLLPDAQGTYIFSEENKALIALFQAVGIKNLRIGGGTAEMTRYALPSHSDLDHLFEFARAAGVKVIYTLRLLHGDKAQATETAQYIVSRYSSQMAFFAIGNEPDWRSYHKQDPRITDYGSYLKLWNEFAAAIQESAPGAKLGGPDTGSNYPGPHADSTAFEGKSWTTHFVNDERSSGRAQMIFQHDYPGQNARGVSIKTAVEAMLSKSWRDINYVALYDGVLSPVLQAPLPYRMTECNDYTGGVDGASNAFVSALWALDYAHWQAAHGAAGINFHNRRWISTCTIYRDKDGQYRLNPKAYGLKTFGLGGKGNVESPTVSNPASLNLTIYATRKGTDYFVTIINMEHGPEARGATVTFTMPLANWHTDLIELTAGGNPTAKIGITLGGAKIEDSGHWQGTWKPALKNASGQFSVKVSATSATIVKFSST